MRHVRRLSVSMGWRAGVLPLCAAVALGCEGKVGGPNDGTGGGTSTPLCMESDPTNVVAPQRIELLTSLQLINTIRLVSEGAAQTIVMEETFPVLNDSQIRFPPALTEQYRQILNSTEISPFLNTAYRVGDYVRDNFATVTGCATADDQCATTFLNRKARELYRRPLSTDEQTRFTDLYTTLKSQMARGYHVATSVQEATGHAVSALLLSPQVLWRWELGNQVSTSPPGVFLTDAELASQLSFFLTNQPPDEMLINDALAGTLRQNVASHVDRILAMPAARQWLTKLMGAYFYLNQVQETNIDRELSKIDIAGPALYQDLAKESNLFLGDVMWKGKVMDLITSRKAFLNSNLATMVYGVAAPAGASPTDFVETMLDPATRSGMLTNAAFITTRARTDGVGVVPRGLAVKAAFLCLDTPSPPESIQGEGGPVEEQNLMIPMMTAQQQVAARAQNQLCNSCHPSFDPYGLVLDWYDGIGRYRTTDHLNQPIDGTTKLPALVGGQTVTTAVELADVLSKTDLFLNCMSRTWLQYGLIDTAIQLPVPKENVPGCAAAGIANQVRKSSTQSFTDLTRAIATSPAFLMRKQVQ